MAHVGIGVGDEITFMLALAVERLGGEMLVRPGEMLDLALEVIIGPEGITFKSHRADEPMVQEVMEDIEILRQREMQA